MSSDRFLASLRGSPLNGAAAYQRVLRQPQRRRQSPSSSVGFGSASAISSRSVVIDASNSSSQVLSPVPFRPQTPPPTSSRSFVSAANLARTISQRKGPASGIFSSSRSGSSGGGGSFHGQSLGAAPPRPSPCAQTDADDIQPAIRALERVLDDEINDLRRVTEKLERRVSSILSLEEHRQLLVRVAERGGSSAFSAQLNTHGQSPMHEAINEVLVRVGALQLGSPAPFYSAVGGSPRSALDNVDDNGVAERSARSSSSITPFIVDLDSVGARRAPAPKPLPPPLQHDHHSTPAAADKAAVAAVVADSKQSSSSHSDDHTVLKNEAEESHAGESPLRNENSEVFPLISARLSSTELTLVEHQRELLALQSEVISQQRLFPDDSQLSRLRLLLRDELSRCKLREARLADMENRFEHIKGD
jgi:hypothetical protein